MLSIKQNRTASPVPDFRNLGVMLRMLLGVNVLALAAALVQSSGMGDYWQRILDIAAWVQPLLLLNLLLLALFSDLLRRLPPLLAQFVVILWAAGLAMLWYDFWGFLAFDHSLRNRSGLLRAALLAGMVAAFMLFYFALRARAFPPTLAEARLQALTARIRPHFLFNSLNAVLSLIRAEPRRAETALEELAELFRALMRDPRDLLPLADEIALCRQYLDLEKLRLGQRLHVEWEIADMPTDLKVPPLMLQPLLENAVYHGIEPSGEPGILRIRFARLRDELHIDLSNPCRSASGAERQRGHHMALLNIRERLMLHYDLEARLEAGEVKLDDGSREYRVHIILPCRNPKR